MEIIHDKIPLEKITKMAKSKFGNLIKAVVDKKLEIMAIDAELHADEEALLIENGSKQEDLWGINIYPEQPRNEWVEFDSVINLKPAQSNRTRGVENPQIRENIIKIVNNLIQS